MRGRKKLQDFFTDEKINQYDRRILPIVVDKNDTVVAIANLRIDDRFKLTENTSRVLTLHFEAREQED